MLVNNKFLYIEWKTTDRQAVWKTIEKIARRQQWCCFYLVTTFINEYSTNTKNTLFFRASHSFYWTRQKQCLSVWNWCSKDHYLKRFIATRSFGEDETIDKTWNEFKFNLFICFSRYLLFVYLERLYWLVLCLKALKRKTETQTKNLGQIIPINI